MFKILFYRNEIVSFEREREEGEGAEDDNYNYKLSGSGQTKSGLEMINELKP